MSHVTRAGEEPSRWADGKWTTKSYDFDTRTPIPFPEDLGEMSTNLIKRIPWDRVFGDSSKVEWQTLKDDYRMSSSHSSLKTDRDRT